MKRGATARSGSLRIISGKWGGRRLQLRLAPNTRPTMTKVRGAFFSIVSPHILDANFLDLFSGSGIMGLEAFSRGAKRVVFCENDRELSTHLYSQIGILQGNAQGGDATEQETHTKDSPLRVVSLDWRRALAKLKNEGNKFDIIYCDPPYFLCEKRDFMVNLVEKVVKDRLLYKDGLLALELRKKMRIPAFRHCLCEQRDYGSTRMLLISPER